jgi:hypothetical protein
MNPVGERDVNGITTESASAIPLWITSTMRECDEALCWVTCRHEVDEMLIWALVPK